MKQQQGEATDRPEPLATYIEGPLRLLSTEPQPMGVTDTLRESSPPPPRQLLTCMQDSQVKKQHKMMMIAFEVGSVFYTLHESPCARVTLSEFS